MPVSIEGLGSGFSLPLALMGLLLCAAGAGSVPSVLAWTLFEVTVVARVALHLAHRLRGERPLLADFVAEVGYDGSGRWAFR